MKPIIRKTWPYLALLAGAGLVWFEVMQKGGISAESWFWLFVAGFIIVLALVEIIRPAGGEGA